MIATHIHATTEEGVLTELIIINASVCPVLLLLIVLLVSFYKHVKSNFKAVSTKTKNKLYSSACKQVQSPAINYFINITFFLFTFVSY